MEIFRGIEDDYTCRQALSKTNFNYDGSSVSGLAVQRYLGELIWDDRRAWVLYKDYREVFDLNWGWLPMSIEPR